MSGCLFRPLNLSLDNLITVRQICNNKLKIINATLAVADCSTKPRRVFIHTAWPNFIFILLVTTVAIKVFIG